MKDPKEIIQKFYYLNGEQERRANRLSYSFNIKNLNTVVFDVDTRLIGDVCYCAEKLQMDYFEYKESFDGADMCVTDKINTAKDAATNNLRCVYIADKENIKKLYLPVLTVNDPDIEIIPPVCSVLHKNGENELVPQYSRTNLLSAIMGQVYPYWSLDYQW